MHVTLKFQISRQGRQQIQQTTMMTAKARNHVTVIAIVIPVLLVVICLVVIFVCRKRLTEHWRKCMIGRRRKSNECSEKNEQTQSQPLVTIKDSVSPTTRQPSDQPVDQVVSPGGSEVAVVTENTKTAGKSRRIPESQDKTIGTKCAKVTGKKKKNLFSGYLYNRAVQLLEKTRAVVITGPEKCGKSALGIHVFNYFMGKGLVPLALGELSQWQEKKQDDKDHVVLLDEFKIDKQSAKTLSSMLLDEHCYIIFIVQSDAMNRECREGGISISLKTLPVVEFVKQVPTDTKRLNQLFEACHKNNVEQVVTLLSGGVDPNRFDKKGKTPLHIACEHGHAEIVSNLLWAGCRVNHQDKQMRTPLHIACEHGHEHIVAQLISARCDVNSQDIHECTPLHIACEHGHLNIVKNLLLAGCDVNSRDNTNSTPLHYACKYPKQSRDDAAANDDKDPSPSQESYESPRETVVKRLLASGASLNAVDNKDRTPLHLACESNNYASVKILLQEGADVQAKDDEGQTPLHVACQHNNRPIVKSLICAKSDVNAKDNEGFTPLHLACAMKANDSVEMLLNANASVEERAEGGMTPLHCACDAGSKEIIQMLLNKGADIHVTDMRGRTPEIVATSKGHLDIIYLVSTAADKTPSQRSVSVDQQLPLDFDHFK
ncbi:hypothetical protein BaRGS_00031941 [Batillaria attramentaria]|uniref:Novel STAND NTPase 3 domain-containing protein n=1 Tax=Batillaria attramentaria TaxID=370345 RepID=A0ABD0JQ58_9CAEN